MKIRIGRAFALCATFAVGAVLLPTADAAPTPAPTIVPIPALDPLYAQRETTATPAIKTQLAQLRQNIQASGGRYVIGYTAALDRPLTALAATRDPPNSLQLARDQAPKQAQMLQLEQAYRQNILKQRPLYRLATPHVPSFTAASSRADWRAEGMVPPIRDQGSCGSCWAFATTGSYESSVLIMGGPMPNSSEQSMVSCAGAGNCDGGYTHLAFPWLVTHGEDSESDFPYTATNAACKTYGVQYQAASWGWVDSTTEFPTVAKMKEAIVAHGPITVHMYATPQFQGYAGGVFAQTLSGTGINHSVVLVGWDDTKGAWILRNSWGTNWGETAGYGSERGYAYVKYGSANVGKDPKWIHAMPALIRIAGEGTTSAPSAP